MPCSLRWPRCLFLHLLPGFHNLQVIAPAPLSPDALPFGMYLNLDKPLVAFWVVLALATPMAGPDARATLSSALLACAGPRSRCGLGCALALGVVGWTPKWPPSGWIWLINNALLVTLAEEALFRGYLQQRLAMLWRGHAWGSWAALMVAAVPVRPGPLHRRLAMDAAGRPGRRGLRHGLPPWRPGRRGAGAPGPERGALRAVHLSMRAVF
jgi:membrane protease YdiL (CAAX protease family)